MVVRHWARSFSDTVAGNMSFLDESRVLLVVGDTVVHGDSEIAASGDWSGSFAPITPVYSMDDVLRNADAEFETLLEDLGL